MNIEKKSLYKVMEHNLINLKQYLVHTDKFDVACISYKMLEIHPHHFLIALKKNEYL